MNPIPQEMATELHLAALGAGEEKSALLEIRYRRDHGMGQHFFGVREYRQAALLARRLSAGTDVYVGVQPRQRRHGGAEAIARCWTLHVDADTPEALERLLTFKPAAAVVNRSGSGGGHGYWPQRVPLTPEQAARANRRLAHHLGGDMVATDAARVLRPAGTKNHKHDPPRLVECIRLEPVSYLAREVVGELVDPPRREPAPVRPMPRLSAQADELQSIPATFYVPALTGREIGRSGKVRCPFHGGGEERTPSLHVYSPPVGPGSWFCFGCERGGSIVDFGSVLYGIEPRGRGFHDIRRRLASDLLPHVREGLAA